MLRNFFRGLRAASVIALSVATFSQVGLSRSVFLNGIDISSAKSQELKSVDMFINERGDIYIVAPHYQVNEEDSYIPLSKYVQSLNLPKHKPPKAMSKVYQQKTEGKVFEKGQLKKMGSEKPPTVEAPKSPEKPSDNDGSEQDSEKP